MGRVVIHPPGGDSEKPFVVGQYTGNASGVYSTQTIQLGFTPSAVIVYRQDGAQQDTLTLGGGGTDFWGGMATASNPAKVRNQIEFIQIVTNGFSVISDTNRSPREPVKANENGYVYYYIAFR